MIYVIFTLVVILTIIIDFFYIKKHYIILMHNYYNESERYYTLEKKSNYVFYNTKKIELNLKSYALHRPRMIYNFILKKINIFLSYFYFKNEKYKFYFICLLIIIFLISFCVIDIIDILKIFLKIT